MAEIPFWVYGDRPKWVSGITPSTSCHDILESLSNFLPGDSLQHQSNKLVLTEKWHDVERPLSSDAKILHIWKAWGDEQKFVKFVVKRVSQKSSSGGSSNHRKRLRPRRGSVSSVASLDELHPRALLVQKKSVQDNDKQQGQQHQGHQEDQVIEEMMKIIEMQRKVITEELMKAKRKAKKTSSNKAKEDLKVILDEMVKLSQLNDKLQFAEESVDRLEIVLKQQKSQDSNHGLMGEHLSCAKTEVGKLRLANDQAALEVKDNQKALDRMEEAKAERKSALKRLEYDVNVIEKEGRKLAKEYEKVLQINLDDLVMEDVAPEIVECDEDDEEIYTLLNSSAGSSSINIKHHEEENSSTSGHSSDMVNEANAKEDTSPIIDEGKNDEHEKHENNSDTGLSSLHTSSDEGTYEVGTLV